MPRPKRNFQSNSFYHIYNRGNNRDIVLKLASDKQIFVNLLYRNKDKCQIRLVNYCIMDNHFHLIVKTGKDPKTLSKFMQRVLTSFAIQINKKHQRIGHTFQGRYNANPVSYTHLPCTSNIYWYIVICFMKRIFKDIKLLEIITP